MGGKITLALLLCLAVFPQTDAAQPRSLAARAEFRRLNPCPATGKPRGRCPGHIVDHVVPLCAGGADHPGNMQWQTIADAKTKDREERLQCRRGRAVIEAPQSAR